MWQEEGAILDMVEDEAKGSAASINHITREWSQEENGVQAEGKSAHALRSKGAPSKNSLEKKMATHSSILTWRIPWMEEPERLESIGLQRVRHD